MRDIEMCLFKNVQERGYWIASIVALLTASSGSFNYFKLSPLIDSIAQEFATSYATIGFLAGIFAFSQLFLSIPIGVIVRPHNLKKAIAYALSLAIIGSLIAGITSSIHLLFLGRILEGASMAMGLVIASFLVAEASTGERTGFGFGILMTYMPIGNILGLNVSSYMLMLSGWRGAWLMGIMLPAIALLLLPMVKTTKRESGRELSYARSLVMSGKSLLLGLIQMGLSVSSVGFLMWTPTFMVKSHGFDVGTASFITSLFMIVGIPACLFGGWLSDKAKSKEAMLTSCFALLTMLYPLTSLIPSPLLSPYIIIIGVLSGLIPVAINTWLVSLFGSSSSIGFGVLNTSRGFSMLIGPLIMGIILSYTTSWITSFTSLSIFTLLACIASLLLARIKT